MSAPEAVMATAAATARAQAGVETARHLARTRGAAGAVALFAAAMACAIFARGDALAAWWTVWAALLAGQLAASLHWTLRGASFSADRWGWRLLGGIALGVWGLLLFEPAQRFSQRLAFDLAQATPWWGVASGLAWCLLLISVPLVGLAATLAWRALAHAVLAGRVSASVPHDLMWVGGVSGLAAAAQAAWAPLGWGQALELSGSAWTRAAQHLSLFVDEYGAAQVVLFAVYVLVQSALARPTRGAAPPLIVFDLRSWNEAKVADTRALHAFACAWGEARGGCVLVREDAHALQVAGQHVRWADAAGRLAELFADEAGAPRRWCATWMAPTSSAIVGPSVGPFVREALLAHAGNLREMALAALAHAPGATCLIIAGGWARAAEVEALRLAWPKQRALLLVDSTLTTPPIARLATVQGELGRWRQRRRLVEEIAQRMQAPTPSESIAVIGRPRSDRLCDQLAAQLDQRLAAQGQRRLDVQRPARDSATRFDCVLLLIDAAWLAGEAEAGVEAASLQPLLEGTIVVSVFVVGSIELQFTALSLAAALRRCGWARPFKYYGRLSDDPQQWPSLDIVERFVNDTPIYLLTGTEGTASRAIAIGVLADDDARLLAHGTVCPALAQRYDGDGVAFQPAPGTPLRLVVPVLSPRTLAAWRDGKEDALSRRLHEELERGTACLPVLTGGARYEWGSKSLPLVARLHNTTYSMHLGADPAMQDFTPLLSMAQQALARDAAPQPTPTPTPAAEPPPTIPAEPTEPAEPAEPTTRPLPRLRDCQYSAYLSYAQADDAAWSGWVGSFGSELELALNARLRGAHPLPVLRNSSSGPAGGSVADELRLRLESSFALILVVHDNYAESEWCRHELEMFKALYGEAGMRERLYIVAMSQRAAERAMHSTAWARLMPPGQQLWMPYYEADDPTRPLAIYIDSQKRQVLTQGFWHRLSRLLDDLTRKMRVELAETQVPVPVVRLRVEVDASDLARWEPLAQSLQQTWREIAQVELARGEPAPTLQLQRPQDGPLEDVDGVLVLWGWAKLDDLAKQVEDIERHLAGPTPPPGAIAWFASPHHPLDDVPPSLHWPVIRFDADSPDRFDALDEDRARLAMFLRDVMSRARSPKPPAP